MLRTRAVIVDLDEDNKIVYWLSPSKYCVEHCHGRVDHNDQALRFVALNSVTQFPHDLLSLIFVQSNNNNV